MSGSDCRRRGRGGYLGLGDVTPPKAPRHFTRVSMRGEAELVAVDHGRPQPRLVPVQLQDLAWGGLGFLSGIPLAVGSRWRALFIQDHQQVGEQTLVIRHCREVAEGVYRTGAQVCIDSGLASLYGVDRGALAGE